MDSTLPRGPELLAMTVRALRLGRGSSHSKELTGETARRYFSGEPIKPESEVKLFRAAAGALLEFGYLKLPALPQQLRGSSADALATALRTVVHRWDEYVGLVRSFAAPVEHPELLAAFMRQLVIDIALRWAAVGELGSQPSPAEGRPLWANESGWSAPLHELKELLNRTGASGPHASWKRVSEELGFETPKSLENWLYAQSRPGEKSIEDLAAVFASADGKGIDEHETRLRRHWGLAAFAHALAERVGWATVGDLADALIRYTREARRRLAESRAPREQLTTRLWMTFIGGIGDENSLNLVKLLHNHEPHAGWAADLDGVITGGARRLHWVARTVAHHEQVRALAAAEGIPEEVIAAAVTLASRLGPGGDARLALSLPPEMRRALFGSRDSAAGFAASAAEAAREDGDLLGAVEGFRRAARLTPQSADAHFRLGSALVKLGLCDEARMEFEVSAQLEPTNYLPQVELGVLHLERGDAKTALEHLERVARAFPDEPLALYNLAIAQLRTGRFAEALTSAERVLAAQPDHAVALATAALCAARAGDTKKARAYGKRAAAFGVKTSAEGTT